MTSTRLDPRAIQRVSGPSWVPLKQTFLDLSECLLSVSDEATARLTTIYVKYQVASESSDPVFAVAWVKTSREIVVGLAFPEERVPDTLKPPLAGMLYPGLTGYLVLRAGDQIPAEFGDWARTAHQTAQGRD